MKPFYRLFIFLYPRVARLISFKNSKAALWLEGRKGLFEKLSRTFTSNTDKIVWMHCSSLGEFEQGRPVLESVRKTNPGIKILLSFFSPSGYEVRKNYTGADWVFYLPMDSPENAKRFFDIVNPSLVLFVKYEFWYYYLKEAEKRNTPLLLVSGVFRSSQPFFKWYGNFYREMLQCFTHLFVQNEVSIALLKSIGIHHTSISGDTRFDRVIEIAERAESFPDIEKFIGNSKVVVAGSTWTEDDEELDHFANTQPQTKFIIAPHNIEEEKLQECLSLYKHAILYSQLKHPGIDLSSVNTLIVDNIGMLSALYRYATICYIGGGFGNDGVHNVLEAAVYSKPVVFGPEYDKYTEAIGLIDADGAFSIESALELEEILAELLSGGEEYEKTAMNAGSFIKQNAGAVKLVIQYIQENRLLTS